MAQEDREPEPRQASQRARQSQQPDRARQTERADRQSRFPRQDGRPRRPRTAGPVGCSFMARKEGRKEGVAGSQDVGRHPPGAAPRGWGAGITVKNNGFEKIEQTPKDIPYFLELRRIPPETPWFLAGFLFDPSGVVFGFSGPENDILRPKKAKNYPRGVCPKNPPKTRVSPEESVRPPKNEECIRTFVQIFQTPHFLQSSWPQPRGASRRSRGSAHTTPPGGAAPGPAPPSFLGHPRP